VIGEAALNQDFEALLEHLRKTHGFDFSGYKRSSLMRRVERRMQQLDGIATFDHYLDFLQVHPEEFIALFNTILINVTAFFRDAAAWEHLSDVAIPRLLSTRAQDDEIRVWSAGCASGEEAYSLAMVLADALGVDAFRRRVKIYATDIDDEALARARQGSYTAKEISGVSDERVERYFEPTAGRFVFRPELRRSIIIFGRHDLMQDAPISRIDLLVCRNTLMYLTAEIQGRVLARLHFALNDSGYLFLGKAEMLLTHADVFTPVDLGHRIFAKVPKAVMHERLLVRAQAGDAEADGHHAMQSRVRDVATEALPLALLVVDSDNTLILATELARSTLGVHRADIGRPLHELEVSYRPIELRSLVDEATRSRTVVTVDHVVRHTPDGVAQHYAVQVAPLFDADGVFTGCSVTFTDVTMLTDAQVELARSRQDLETVHEELQSTNEELETTNEELQSTNEELETTNEELQSTNEELEATNEELQATNSELQAINNELRDQSVELDRVNLFMGSVLTSLRGGLAVLDHYFTINVWTDGCEELWGLRSSEAVGRSLFDLDIGLPLAALRAPLERCVANRDEAAELEVDAVNRRGRAIRCRLSCLSLQQPDSQEHGAVLMMEELGPGAAAPAR
jgi:two-component system CheB/CheR fusion protein